MSGCGVKEQLEQNTTDFQTAVKMQLSRTMEAGAVKKCVNYST